jgi:hypothetical protein
MPPEPGFEAWSTKMPAEFERRNETVLPLVQPERVMVKVTLFEVLMAGVDAQPVTTKSLAVSPKTASLKVNV